MKALGITQRGHLEALARHAVMPLQLVGNELRVGEDYPRPFQRGLDAPGDFGQAICRLRLRIVDMGQVVQGHQHRAGEIQRPQTGLVVQVHCRMPQPPLETTLLEQAPNTVGTRHLLGPGDPAAVAGQRRWRQLPTPTPAMKELQLQRGIGVERRDQLDQVLADAGARRLEDASVKGNPHRPLPCSECHEYRAGFASPAAQPPPPSRSIASARPRGQPGTGRTARTP
jgi:hypothetical protein